MMYESNENNNVEKNKKNFIRKNLVWLISIAVVLIVGIIFLVFNNGKIDFKSLMGNSVTTGNNRIYICDRFYKPDGNGKCVSKDYNDLAKMECTLDKASKENIYQAFIQVNPNLKEEDLDYDTLYSYKIYENSHRVGCGYSIKAKLSEEPKTEYSCETGYTYNGKECIKVENETPKESMTCETGYTSDKNGKCKKIINATTKYSCEQGYSYNGKECIKSKTEITDAKKIYNCDTANDYYLNGNQCEKIKLFVKEAKSKNNCSKGYSYINKMCIKVTIIDKKQPTITYGCSFGYTKNGTKCSKTITTTKKAKKTLICSNDYTLSGNKCISKATKNKVKVKYCKEGFTLSQDGKKCTKTIRKEVKTKYSCNKGYNLDGKRCVMTNFPTKRNLIFTTKDEKYFKYSCKDSYRLSGDRCYRIIDPNGYFIDISITTDEYKVYPSDVGKEIDRLELFYKYYDSIIGSNYSMKINYPNFNSKFNLDAIYESSNPSVVKVQNNKLILVGEGITTIKIKIGEYVIDKEIKFYFDEPTIPTPQQDVTNSNSTTSSVNTSVEEDISTTNE